MRENETDGALLVEAETKPDAFRVLYDRHAARLYAYARGQTGDADAATEIVAETFAQAWRSRRRARSDADGSLAPWLYGIARNLLRHHARHRRVVAKARTRLGLEVPAAAPEHEIVARLDAEETRSELRAAIGSLPADHRHAVGLRVLGDLPYDEIASRLGCTAETARARVSRGLRILHTSLEGARK